jgi:hypothetical protein
MLGSQQVVAVLKRNVIEKRRNSRVTCCEFCSHLIIILLLMYGYALSEVFHFDAEKYSNIELHIPPRGIGDAVDMLNGPLPIPSFDAFIGASRILDSVGGDSDGVLGIFAQTGIGRRFGNLVRTGALHFAPDGPEVVSLVDYLNRTTITFSTMVHHVHKSEKHAINYIQNNLDEYALALIVLPGPDVLTENRIEYKIRQNYTTLPNTNQVVNWIS